MKHISQYILESQTDQVKLFCVGDILAHEEVLKDSKNGDSYNFNSMFKFVKDITKNYDISFCNQESILGGRELGLCGGKTKLFGTKKQPCFNSPKELGDAVVGAGFNLISLANNHFIDMDDEGLKNSISYWENQKVIFSGQGESNVKFFTKNNIKFAFIAYTQLCNHLLTSNLSKLANVYSDNKARKDIEYAKTKADVVIVSMHWGREYYFGVMDIQYETAQFLSSLGVDIIIGHHPHVVEPIKYINNTLVIYSLGNFLACQDGDDEKKRVGLMVGIDIIKEGPHIKCTPSAELCYIYYNLSDHTGFEITPFSQLTDDKLPNFKDVEKKYWKIVEKYMSINRL